MKRIIIPALMLLSMSAGAQTFENKYTRPLSDVLKDVSARFGVRLKYNVDTTGLKLEYADFRVRPTLSKRLSTTSCRHSTSKPLSRTTSCIRLSPTNIRADSLKTERR